MKLNDKTWHVMRGKHTACVTYPYLCHCTLMGVFTPCMSVGELLVKYFFKTCPVGQETIQICILLSKSNICENCII